jgi:uronate dehydrogenase
VKTVDNRGADHLGYVAQDNSEPFRAAVEAKTPIPDPTAPSVKYLGGWFCELGHPDDEPGLK